MKGFNPEAGGKKSVSISPETGLTSKQELDLAESLATVLKRASRGKNGPTRHVIGNEQDEFASRPPSEPLDTTAVNAAIDNAREELGRLVNQFKSDKQDTSGEKLG